MKIDKYSICAQVINRLESSLKTLRTDYICDLIDDFKCDIQRDIWMNACELKKCNNGTYILSSNKKYTEIIAHGSGDIYIGHLDNNHNYLGKSIYLFNNGNVFVGDFKQGSGDYCIGNMEYANGTYKKDIEFGPENMFESKKTKPFLRSSNFFTRIFCDKAIGRVDFLLVSILLLTIGILAFLWLFESDSDMSNYIKVLALLFLQIFMPLLGLFIYVKRCRDCRIGFWGGLLMLIFSISIIILYFYKGKLAMRRDYYKEAAQRVRGPETDSSGAFDRPSAAADELSDRLRNKQGYPMEKAECSPHNNSEDDNARNRKSNSQPINKQKYDNSEEDTQGQSSKERKNEEKIYYLRYQFQQYKHRYENAKQEAEKAESNAKTELYYANDEKNKFELYKDKDALDRASEYEENAKNYLREAEQMRIEANEYESKMNDLRNELSDLGEFM